MADFEYQPLRGSEIRLVRFVSTNENFEDSGKPWSSTFEGLHLEHHDLATAPPYLALSYVWGDTADRVTVEIDGRPVPVTGNLCQALAHIWVFHDELERGLTAVSAPVPEANDIKSDSQLVLYLWIDALCINQASFEERAVQVPRMAAIYSTACTTLVWFGRLPLDEGKLPVHLESLLELFEATVPVAPFPRRHFPRPPAGANPTEGRLRMLMGVLKIYGGLMNNPWFKRMWVFQEYALSRRPLLALWGPALFSLQAFLDAGPVLAEQYLDEPNIAAALALPVRHLQANLERQRTQLLGPPALRAELASAAFRARPVATQLLTLLLGMAPRQATVMHDHLYGLLGLVSAERLPAALQLDYTKSYGAACQQYTRYLLEETGDLRVLGSVDPSFDRTDDNAGRGVPRWVPAAHLLDVATRAPRVRGPVVYSPRWGRLHVHAAKGPGVVCYFGARGPAAAGGLRLCAFHDTVLAQAASLRGISLGEVWRDWLRQLLGEVLGLPAESGDGFADPQALLAAGETRSMGSLEPQWVTEGFSREDVLLTETGAVLRWPCHRAGAASGQVEVARDDALWALKGATEWYVLRRVGVEDGADACRMMGRVPALDLDDTMTSGGLAGDRPSRWSDLSLFYVLCSG